MSFYRNTYLKSEHWQDLRITRIKRQGGICAVCKRKFGLALDVHHVVYKKLYDVKRTDLRALCRECHDDIHYVLNRIEKPKGCPSLRWRTALKATRRWKEDISNHGKDYADARLIFLPCVRSYCLAKARFNFLRKLVIKHVDVTMNGWEMRWTHQCYEWILSQPKYLTATAFYNKWLVWTDCKYAHPCGDHDGIEIDADHIPFRSKDGQKQWDLWMENCRADALAGKR